MTEQLSHNPAEHDTDTLPKRVTIKGLPSPVAFSDRTISQEFTVYPKSGIAEEKATMIGGEPVESESTFPGVHTIDEMPITTRAEARQRKGRHAHESKHAAPTERTLFTPEQLQAARDHLANVLGRVAIVKDDLLDTRVLSKGDHGDDEIYVGRHRAGHSQERSNRIKRSAYRLATIFDKKLHDYREGHVAEYDAVEDEDAPETSSTVESSTARPSAAEGDEVMFGGNKWTVEILDEVGATIQRENEDGETEIENISLEDLDRLTVATAAPEADDTQVFETQEDDEQEDQFRAKLQKLRDLPLLFAAKMATRRHMKNESLTEEHKDDRRRYRRLAMLGAAGVATLLAVKYGHDYFVNHANDAATAGSGNGIKNLPLNNGGGSGREAATEFSKAAEHISRGEGINQTMKEMGIPRDKWNEVLKKAGPKLVKMHAAYRDQKIGGYGWSEAGPAKKAALKVIADTYKSLK